MNQPHLRLHQPSISAVRSSAILAVFGVALASAGRAQVDTVAVDATQSIRVVDERVFGVNAVMWDAQLGSDQTLSLVDAAGIRTIRIPGGSLSDTYHWVTNKPDGQTWSWMSGFNAFSRLINAVKGPVFVTVNYGTGTPEEAAAWVAYANASATLQGTAADVTIGVDSAGTNWRTAGYWSALRASTPLATDDGRNFLRLGQSAGFALKYWEIGNEIYGSWETDNQVAPHEPYTYANRTQLYWAKMKAVDPTIKVGVVAVTGEDGWGNNTTHSATNPRTGAVHYGWTPVMLARLKALGVTPDYLIYHEYEQNPGFENDAALLQAGAAWPGRAADLRQQLGDYLGSAGSGVELCVTENNSTSSDSGKQNTSLVNGLYQADSVGNLLQTEFNSLVWWALRNGPNINSAGTAPAGNMSSSLYGWRPYGDAGILSMPNSVTGETTYYDAYPNYYILKLLSQFARGGDTVVRATSNNSLLSVFASKRAGSSLSVLFVNKSPTATQTANVTLAGFVPQSAARTYSYGIPQDTAAQTGIGSADIASSSQNIAGSSFTLDLAPYSATVLRMTAVGAASIIAPGSLTVAAGQTAVFAVNADGNPAPTCQWQASADGGTTWANLANDGTYSNATTSTLLVANAGVGLNGYQYRCVATNSAGWATSAPATLAVVSEPALVNLLFTDVLGRPADAGGLASFESALSAGSTPTALLDDLLGSAEYRQRQVEQAIRLYYAALARMPDYTGLQNWSNALQQGRLTLTSAADQFAGSQEFLLKYGSLDNTAYVQQLYLNVLGRPADSAGLADWVSQLDSGASRGAVLVGFSESSEFKADTANQVEIERLYFLLLQRMPIALELQGWLAFLNADGQTDALYAQAYPYGLLDADFVQAAFRGFLCRDADAGALGAFTNALANGSVTHAGLVDTLMSSAEFSQFSGPVSRLYLSAFQRVPDQAGLVNWVGYLKGGNSLQSVADYFASSPEFTLRYGSLNDNDYVTQLYLNVLGRAPDPAGLADWTGLLAGGRTRGQVLIGFSESPEAIHLFAPALRTCLSYFALFNAAPVQTDLNYWGSYQTTLTEQLRQTLLDEAASGI